MILLSLFVIHGTFLGVMSATTADRKELFIDTVLNSYVDLINPGCACAGEAQGAGGSPLVRNTCAQQQRHDLVGSNRVSSRDPALSLWAYRDMPIQNPLSLETVLCQVDCDRISTSDFDLNLIVRVLYLSDHDTALQQDIVNQLQEKYDAKRLRLWQTVGDGNDNLYLTENHIVLWLSCTLLLRPWLNTRPDDDAFLKVETRLLDWLETKKAHGFYEFFSKNYYPRSLAALLNLHDFATESPRIQSLATEVASRLMEEILLFTTMEGQYYPVVGRGEGRNFLEPRFFGITWILLGQGFPLACDTWRDEYAGPFLATSSIDLDPIAAKFESSINMQFQIGHPTTKHKEVHSTLNRVDRTLTQWSAGDILQPKLVTDSLFVLSEYQLQGIPFLPWIIKTLLPLIGGLVNFFTWFVAGQIYGSSITEATVSIFKHNGVALASLQDFHVGSRGFQQYPVMATVGDIAVWTQAGISGRCFLGGIVENIHLPQVIQDGNVALIAYRPKIDVRLVSRLLSLFGVDFETVVSLRFPEDQFDEVQHVATNWIIGRRGDNYVGVWRHALDKFDCSSTNSPCEEHYFSDDKRNLSTSSWVIVVGNSATHGDFSTSFSSMIAASEVHEDLTRDGIFKRPGAYIAEVNVDGKVLRVEL